MKGFVALYKDRKYTIGTLTAINRFSKSSEFDYPTYPTLLKTSIIQPEFLDIIPDVGYIEEGENLKIFDKSKEEYETLSFPICIDYFGEIRLTGKTVDLTVPTEDSICAAKEILEKVESKVKDAIVHSTETLIENEIEKNDGLQLFEFDDWEQYDIARDFIYNLRNVGTYRIIWKYETSILIAKPSLAFHKSIDLYAPKSLMGMIIGKGGENIKQMAQFLHCKINLKEK